MDRKEVLVISKKGYIDAYCQMMDLCTSLSGKCIPSRIHCGEPMVLETQYVTVSFMTNKDEQAVGKKYDAVFDNLGQPIESDRLKDRNNMYIGDLLSYLIFNEIGRK